MVFIPTLKASIAENPDVHMLDTRVLPEWELLDLYPKDTYEFSLYNSVIDEFTHISGFPIHYYLYSPEFIDPIYGEAPLAGFIGPFPTKILFETPRENFNIDSFGMLTDDTIQYAEMPKTVFQRDIIGHINKRKDIPFPVDQRKPVPNDVIRTLWDDKYWQIEHVATSERVFQGMKLTWNIVLKPFVYSAQGYTKSESASGVSTSGITTSGWSPSGVLLTTTLDDMFFSEPVSGEYHVVNHSVDKLDPEKELMENKYIEEEAKKGRNLKDVDSTVYGYEVL